MAFSKRKMLQITALAVGVLQAAEKEDWDLAYARLERMLQIKEGNPAVGWVYAIGVILRYALFRGSRVIPGGPFAGYAWPIPGIAGLGISGLGQILGQVEGAGVPGARKRKKYK